MAKAGKELRILVDEDVHAFIMATAKARKITPARVVSDAVKTHWDVAPRLEVAIKALSDRRQQRDDLALSIDEHHAARDRYLRRLDDLEADSLTSDYDVDDHADHRFS